MAIIRDNTTPAQTLKVNADGSINTTVSFPAAGLEIANDVGNPVPVNGTVTANAGSGSFTVAQATAGNLNATVAQGAAGASAWPVNANQSGTWAVTANAGTGTFAVSGSVTSNAGTGTFNAQIASGTGTAVGTPLFVTPSIGGAATSATNALFVQLQPSKVATVTGASAAATTLTIPAPAAGQFNYITSIEILLVNTAARAAAAATLLTVTSTNVGGLTFNFGSPTSTVGSSDRTAIQAFASPIKSDNAATATTLAVTATTGVQWQFRATYFQAP